MCLILKHSKTKIVELIDATQHTMKYNQRLHWFGYYTITIMLG